MKSLLNNNTTRNQTAVRKLRFKRESGLGDTNGCFVHSKKNAPPNSTN